MSRILGAFAGALLLLLVAAPCLAQEDRAKDGVWLKSGVDAFNRIAAVENVDTRSPDFRKSEELVSYIEGMLFVHRQNNMMASVVAVALQEKHGESSPVTPEARMALAFAPLLRIPDNLSRYQAVAILDKYLKDHPADWGDSAGVIITKALKAAFEPSQE